MIFYMKTPESYSFKKVTSAYIETVYMSDSFPGISRCPGVYTPSPGSVVITKEEYEQAQQQVLQTLRITVAAVTAPAITIPLVSVSTEDPHKGLPF